jgi:hypothetical protein
MIALLFPDALVVQLTVSLFGMARARARAALS